MHGEPYVPSLPELTTDRHTPAGSVGAPPGWAGLTVQRQRSLVLSFARPSIFASFLSSLAALTWIKWDRHRGAVRTDRTLDTRRPLRVP